MNSNEKISCSYDFDEHIPVWRTWWFGISAGALGFGLVAAFLTGWI